MNNNDPNQTLAQLQLLGLIAPTAINTNAVGDNSDSDNLYDNSHDNMHNNTPWFLHVFFGFSGVLSSIFLVGFLTLLLYQADIFDNSGFQLAVGIALSAAALTLFKNEKSRNNTFLNSLAFAISGAGQLYLMFALFSSEIAEPLSIWLFLLIQVTMTIIMLNFIYRLLSSMAALGGMVYLLSFYQVPELSLGLLALVTIVANLQRYELLQYLPVKWCTAGFDISKAIAYASAIMLLLFSVYIVAGEYSSSDFVSNDFSYNYILAQGLLILASLYAAHIILKRYHIKLLSIKSVSQPDIIIVCAIVIVGIMSVYISGLLATSLIIVIAMANSQRVLLGLGVLALISYIFWYYYQLDTSLLLKSGSMLVIGIVMLIIRWLLVSRYFANDDSSLSDLSKALTDKPTNSTANRIGRRPASQIDSQERS